MNKKLVASVLLASMAAAYPVYAEDDRTPDEYNPDAKYVSPLDEPERRIVNDRPVLTEREAETDRTSRAAKGADQTLSTSRAQALEAARNEAEEQLMATDENFEPELTEEYPGFEYQARKYAFSVLRAPEGTLPTGKSALPAGEEPERQGAGDQASEGKESSPLSDAAQHGDLTGQAAETEQQAMPAASAQTDQMSRQGLAGETQTASAAKKGIPLIITGEDARYSSESGDFIISGKVKLQQGKTRLYSTKAVGNAKTGDVWLLEGGTLVELGNTTRAHWGHYNFNKKTGELRHIEGQGLKDSYQAPHGLIENGMLIMDQGGRTTRCPAVKHPPCLEVRAKTITVIPNDRIVARGVQVFVKGVHIYSRDVWINDLTDAVQRTMPRIGWKDKKGFYVSLDYEQPIGNPLLKNPTKAYMHQVYYTKAGYKPFYGIRHDEHDFYVRLHHGYVYDSDNDLIDEGIWLHKKMDWGLFLKPHRIAPGLPLTYEGHVTHGLWKYTHRNWSSRHTEKAVYLRHDRFYPLGGKKLYMDLMVGRKWVDESNPVNKKYGKSLHSNIYQGTLGYKFSQKWNIWERYHQEHKTSYNFSLGQPDFAKEWRTGISWKPDDKNTITVVNRYNADKSRPRYHGNYSTTYSWAHRFCCEVLTISYEKTYYDNDHEWTIKFDFLNW